MELAEKKRLLEELMKDRGFILLNELMQEQVDALQRDILFNRCTSVDSALSQEYSKGQVEGRLAWVALLDAQLASLEMDLNNLKEDEENDAGFDAD